MAGQRHILDKVAIDLTLPGEEGALTIQERWASILREQVVPGLAGLFDKLVPADEVWRVDKLDVDLGIFSKQTSDQAIAKAIVQGVLKSFENYQATANGSMKKLPVASVELETLVVFLLKGYLRDGVPEKNVREVFNKHVENDLSGFLTTLRNRLNGSSITIEEVARRLTWQFEEKDLLSFLDHFLSAFGSRIGRWLQEFYKEIIARKVPFSRPFRDQFWQVFFNHILDATNEMDSFDRSFLPTLVAKVDWSEMDESIQKHWRSIVPEEVAGELGKWTKPPSVKTSEKAELESAPDPVQESVVETETGESIFCHYAGVILLHPFLSGFFQSAGLLEEDSKTFKSPEEAFTGVYLVHYLATGREGGKEEELAFAKFICGLKMSVPIPPFDGSMWRGLIKPKMEAEELLQAAIGHWKALRNTSPDGLREAFLQRKGRLTAKQSGYLLEIENETTDILLGKLPWGLSVVRLPWMDSPLWVHWG